MSNDVRGERRPAYRIEVDQADLTARIAGRLIGLTLTDNRGFEADQLDLVLSDADGKLDLPSRGASLRVWIGWEDSGLVDKGQFTVDEIEHSGAPDVLTIRGRSADMRGGLTTQRERSWHGKTLGEIVASVAAENGLIPAVASSLIDQVVDHVDQTNESAANLLTRLARMFDAIATVKSGRLLLFPAAGAASASGQPLPPVTITRADGDSHRFTLADRESYTHVRATWHDLDTGTKGEIIWGAAEDAAERDAAPDAEGMAIDNSAENIKTLRHVYAVRANAKRGARAEWRRLRRGMAGFAITLAHGRPELFPELPASVAGFKPAIDNTDWLITRATHSLSDSGYTTAIELEIRATEIPG